MSVPPLGHANGYSRLRRDIRGVVYVEFLLAFIPLFVLFLGTTQLGLMSVAQLVVQHAASRGARTAIVVLEDNPDEYGGAPRGNVLAGGPVTTPSTATLLQSGGGRSRLVPDEDTAGGASKGFQQIGARMAPIRFAAYAPLAILAPSTMPEKQDNSPSGASLVTAPAYNQAAAVVTLQAAPATDELAPAQIPSDRDSTVTVRVTYLYSCSIPIVRRLMCATPRQLGAFSSRSGDATAAGRRVASLLEYAEAPRRLAAVLFPHSRVAVLSAEATLPNQGAAYD